jgi:glycosyltransferase involved in cell wall biosynthesis
MVARAEGLVVPIMSQGGIVYVCFDRVPAPKGAAIHIEAFAGALARAFGALELVSLPAAAEQFGASLRAEGLTHHQLPVLGDTIIERVMDFRARLGRWWGPRRPAVVHLRSIYEGYPIAIRKTDVCERIVFEVNGLPSIELKYHYPAVAEDRELLQKLTAQEQVCLDAADLVVTPSRVTAEYLRTRGVSDSRLRVIPNGVDTAVFDYRAPQPLGSEVRLLYWGTLAAWQGVAVAIEALRLCRRDFPARLTLVGQATNLQKKRMAEAVAESGLAAHVTFLPGVSQSELTRLIHEHNVALAPLLANDRNEVQGCCPLKVIEAMAAGIPLVASDLAVVSDLAQNDVHALLVRPGSGKAIKDAILRLRADPALGVRLSAAARRRVEEQFTWQRASEQLIAAYQEVLGITPKHAGS